MQFRNSDLETVFLMELLLVFYWLCFFESSEKCCFCQGKLCFFFDVSRNEKAREFLRLSFETVSLETVFLMELLVVF